MSKKKEYLGQDEILCVKNLTAEFPGKHCAARVLSDVDISMRKGEILGLVGASGSGKSILARCLLRLESPARIISGSIFMSGENLLTKNQRDMQKIRGKSISLVPQNSLSAFDPLFTVGNQFHEVLRVHKDSLLSEKDTKEPTRTVFKEKIYDLLRGVGIASPRRRSQQYPHQWSAGMRQRALIAMALCTSPDVLILDEVVSALDPTVCLQILDLILHVRKQHGTSILFITHDMDVVREICDRVAVMYCGCTVEEGATGKILAHPSHPHTRSLISGVV